MIVLCSWCQAQDKPAFLRETPPFRDPSVSHGICPPHREEWTRQIQAHVAALKVRQEGGSP